MRGARAVHRQVPADHEPGRRQGDRRHRHYVYNRLVSLNEVGADPTQFGVEPTAVHAWMYERQRRWPSALSATSTHDTKRGEDIRARLNVLSEMPGEWKSAVAKWRAVNRRFKRDVGWHRRPGRERGVSALPDARRRLAVQPRTDSAALPERIGAIHDEGDARSEGADQLDQPRRTLRSRGASASPATSSSGAGRPFLQAFLPFQARVAELGIYNSLAQLLIKITAPGIPDFYQGTELWDCLAGRPRQPPAGRLRAPARGGHSAEVQDASTVAGLLEDRADGRIKTFVMARALRQRAAIARGLRPWRPTCRCRSTAIAGAMVFAFARRGRNRWRLPACRGSAGLLGGRTVPPDWPGDLAGHAHPPSPLERHTGVSRRDHRCRNRSAHRRRCRLARRVRGVRHLSRRPARSCRLTPAHGIPDVHRERRSSCGSSWCCCSRRIFPTSFDAPIACRAITSSG